MVKFPLSCGYIVDLRKVPDFPKHLHLYLDPATVNRSGGQSMNGSEMNGSDVLEQKRISIGKIRK